MLDTRFSYLNNHAVFVMNKPQRYISGKIDCQTVIDRYAVL